MSDLHDRKVAKKHTRDALDNQDYRVLTATDGREYAVPQAICDTMAAALDAAGRENRS